MRTTDLTIPMTWTLIEHAYNSLNIIRDKHRRAVVLLAVEVSQDHGSKGRLGEPFIEAGDTYGKFAAYCRQGID